MSSSKPEQGQSLADLYPKIAKEWHPDKNGDLKPTDVTAHSHTKVWWKCSKGHEWEAKVQNRVANRTGCPYCSGNKVIIGENDLQTLYPDIAKEWHPTLNGDLKPTDVKPGSGKRVWWECSVCSHEWQATIANRTYNHSGCPECARNRRKKQ